MTGRHQEDLFEDLHIYQNSLLLPFQSRKQPGAAPQSGALCKILSKPIKLIGRMLMKYDRTWVVCMGEQGKDPLCYQVPVMREMSILKKAMLALIET